ncbi:MAG: exosortase C-terminal domain/associated protein EpsI [Pyrinomonadaceae bacterium]
MKEQSPTNTSGMIKAAAVAAAIAFLYATVLSKLGLDWWTDENYSHGLLVPFVIGFIVWQAWPEIRRRCEPSAILGGSIVLIAMLFLIAGTLGSELFTQRMSFVLMLTGIVVYFFGKHVVSLLAVPFALLILAIPIPQIVFNRIAFPLQIWASQMAVWGIRLFEVPTLRKGNVIDILPKGSMQTISLEVVEACSGIRSLMTLVTLALILAYFTRRSESRSFAGMPKVDLIRAAILMIAAVLIAVITNAARVTVTGVCTYYYGKQATEGSWHDMSGWLVYVVALGILIALNLVLKRIFRSKDEGSNEAGAAFVKLSSISVVPLVVVMVTGGLAVNWFASRSEVVVPRQELAAIPEQIGEWKQRGSAFKFDIAIEGVLKTTDYTMREYSLPDGRIGNIYVGYYASQRGGATYHSPQNCLPGAGWVMKDPKLVEITRPDGTTFTANRYIIENGIYSEVMIYWYQGRGRTEASEYRDKVNTVWDSVFLRRSDGAMVRVMTSVGSDEDAAIAAASDLSAGLAGFLTSFVPE